MSRITRFWHRPRATSLDDTAVLWADLPEEKVPVPIEWGTVKASVLADAGAQNPAVIYGGTLQYGSVTWLTGLQFSVSACGYIIDGVTYTSPQTTITLDTADGSNPRIDVVYVDTDGLAGKLTGTPAADPAKPEIDPSTQLELTHVIVAALATAPTDVAATAFYLEDAGDPAEWDATESTTGARITLDDTSDPYTGTKAILFDAVVVGDSMTLTAGTGAAITTGDLTSLETHLSLTSLSGDNTGYLRVAFFNGPNRVSAWVNIAFGSFGYAEILGYQTVTIPNADFKFTDGTANILVFEAAGKKNSTASLSLDQVRMQLGGGTTIINITQGLTESDLVNNVRQFNVQQPFGADALTDEATITWNLDTDPVATITLDGNRTLNAINMRAGGTYILKVIQDDTTGTRLITWGSMFEWAGGTAPTLTATVDGYDMFSFVAFDALALLGATGGLEFS